MESKQRRNKIGDYTKRGLHRGLNRERLLYRESTRKRNLLIDGNKNYFYYCMFDYQLAFASWPLASIMYDYEN